MDFISTFFYSPTVLLLLVASGLLGGFLVGLLGIGGGMVFVPILSFATMAAGLPPDVQVKCVLANSLLTIIFSGLAATYRQHKKGNFHLKPTLAVGVPGMVASMLVSYFYVLHSGLYSKKQFTVVFLVVVIFMFVRMILSGKGEGSRHATKVSNTSYGFVGVFTGILSSLSGIGGGVVMTPALSQIFKITLQQAIGISTASVPFFALANTFIYALAKSETALPEGLVHAGYILPGFVLPLILGSIATVPLGVKVGHMLKAGVVKTIFVVFLGVVIAQTVHSAFIAKPKEAHKQEKEIAPVGDTMNAARPYGR